MWELSSHSQIIGFLYSLLTGIIFCVIYDMFKAFRLNIKSSAVAIFFQDIIYFGIISLIAFCFFLVFTSGEIRFYIILGFVFGYTICRFTLSRILLPILSGILLGFVSLRRFFLKLFDKIFTLSGNIFKKIEKISKNTLKSIKKLLKKTEGLLYTNEE